MPHPEAVKSHCPLDHGWVLHMWGILGRREISSPSWACPQFFLEEVPIEQAKHCCFSEGDQFYRVQSDIIGSVSLAEAEAKAGPRQVSYLSLTQGAGAGTCCPLAPPARACSWVFLSWLWHVRQAGLPAHAETHSVFGPGQPFPRC